MPVYKNLYENFKVTSFSRQKLLLGYASEKHGSKMEISELNQFTHHFFFNNNDGLNSRVNHYQ